jgi:hypothetical protein
MLSVSREVSPEVFNQAKARRLASISTGRVIKLNSVVNANITMPINMSCGKVLMSNMPASKTHWTIFDEKLTMGTSLERSLSGA